MKSLNQENFNELSKLMEEMSQYFKYHINDEEMATKCQEYKQFFNLVAISMCHDDALKVETDFPDPYVIFSHD